MTGVGFGMTGIRFGMTGMGFGMAGVGFGMTGVRFGMAGIRFGMTANMATRLGQVGASGVGVMAAAVDDDVGAGKV